MRFTRIMVLFLLGIVMAHVVEAISIGISPPRVIANDLLRGSHFEKTVVLSRSEIGEELKVTIQTEGQLTEWISTDQGLEFIFPQDARTLPITITIDVPEDAANGQYEGTIRIRAESVIRPETGVIGTAVAVGVLITATVTVTGEQVLDYSIPLIKVPDTEEGSPLYIILTVDNKGNVEARPTKVNVRVFDKFKEVILLTRDVLNSQSVEPFVTGEIILPVLHMLKPEQYWALLKVYNEEVVITEDEIVFEVFERGSLKKEGLLKELITKAQVDTGEVVKITTLFENKGASIVSAKLVAEIYFSDTLINVVEGEPLSVGAGKTELLEAYFTPTSRGLHTIKAHVLFSGRRTDTKVSTFVVGKGISSNALLIGILILIISIVVIMKRFKGRSTRDKR